MRRGGVHVRNQTVADFIDWDTSAVARLYGSGHLAEPRRTHSQQRARRASPPAAIPPRCLSRVEAARYVGVSPTTFDAEVKAGLWPTAIARRDASGRLITRRKVWDQRALDEALDRSRGTPQGAGNGWLRKLGHDPSHS
jgi:hypothetical protein